MANDFDPDAFLAEGGGFDPDAFLSETAETPAVTAPEVGEPSRARRVLFGLAKTPGLVEEAVQLIEQKAGARPEEREVITRQTLRHPDVPEDVPLTPEEMEEAEMVTQTIHKVTPGRTEQEIRDEQAARRQSRLAQDFPDLVEDGTLEDDPWVTTGEVTRLVTDLITVPLPVAQQAKLGKMAAQGEKVMGSAAGRAQLGKAVTEGALGIGAFGAADNTIRQLSATGQLNAEELGYAALISGAAGGTLGPALFAGGGKVLKYLNRKHAADADVTADDIINTGAEIDVVITRPEAEEILAASNRLRDITRVEARTLDDAFGIKTADEIKAKTDARRADLIEAYRKDAEHADFQKRKADEIQQRRDLARARRNTPYEALDKQREAEIERGFAAIEEAEEGIITPGEMGQLDPSRSPLVIPKSPLRVDHSFHRPTIDEYAVARITERQNEELARLEMNRAREKPAVKEAEAIVQENANRMDEGLLLSNPNAARNKQGDLVTPRFGNAVIDRIRNIAPRLATGVRRVSQRTAVRSEQDILSFDKFYKSPEYSRLSRKERRSLEAAMKNGDGVKIRQITNRIPRLTELYETHIRKWLDQIGRERRAAGEDGFIFAFHPRVVRNVRKLRRRLSREDRSKLRQVIDRATLKKGSALDEFELSQIYNQAIGGRALRVDKNRRINAIEEKDLDLYENSRNEMIAYAHRHREEEAIHEFFKNNLGREIKVGENVTAKDVGDLMAQARASGAINDTDLTELAELLSLQFGVGRQGPGKLTQGFKNLFTTGSLGFNPMSTLTQIQDFSQIMHRFGVRDSLTSLFGPKIANVYDVGLRELARDSRTPHGTAKLVRAGLKSFGFDKLDKIMANTSVNASLRRNFRMAQKDPARLLQKLERDFTPTEARRLLDDYKNRRISDDMRTHVLSETADIRPAHREDMPVSYQRHPNGRVMYSLLSWTLKQMNFARNTHLNNIRQGKVVKGVTGLMSMALLMGITGAPVIMTKQWLRGQDVEPDAAFVQGMLSLGMSGKFLADNLAQGRGDAAAGNLWPVLGITGQTAGGWVQGMINGEPVKLLTATPAGRNLHSFLTSDFAGALAGGIGAVIIPDASGKYIQQEIGTHAPLSVMPPVERVLDDVLNDGSLIKDFENPRQVGRDAVTGLWMPHPSIEGGTDTLGYGHKLTKQEQKSGKLRLGGELVNWTQGLSDEQIEQLYQQDTKWARDAVYELVSVPLSANEFEAVTSLVYNIGRNAFAKSKALKALNAGDRDEFVRQAFDSQIGWTKANGKVLKGLVRRRAAEANLFLGNV